MDMPFTVEQFFDVFKLYNIAIWPMQIVAYILGALVVYFAFSDKPIMNRAIFAILGSFWIWMGAIYHMIYFTPINPAAWIFGIMFIIQGILFLYYGTIRTRISISYHKRPTQIIGALFVLYGMAIYPLLNFVFGHHYPSIPMFGVVPCPTTIFTFGILLWAKSTVSLFVIIIPLLWSLIGLSAAVSLGVPQDYGLVIAGVLGTILIVMQNRKKKLLNQEL